MGPNSLSVSVVTKDGRTGAQTNVLSSDGYLLAICLVHSTINLFDRVGIGQDLIAGDDVLYID